MRCRLIFAFVIPFVLTLSACDQKPTQNAPAATARPAAPSAPAVVPHLIREGVGVAGVELGMTPSDVERVLGKAELTNKAGSDVVYMSYDAGEIFGVYFDAGHVRMIIAAKKDKTWCTDFDVCLYREGDLAKLKAHHGAKLFRFVERDGSVTLRLLTTGAKPILTEYTPNEEHAGVAQVTIMYWNGKIDTSSYE